MQIIRDEETNGLMMIPLLHDWGIRRCNAVGCREKPNTIIAGAAPNVSAFGLCEEHFQQGNVPGGTKLSLEFDDFDAWAAKNEDVGVIAP